MQAVIMAGGKGTRLAAVTKDEIPKPMAVVAGKPILQHQIEALKNNGITEIIITLGHLGDKIKSFCGDGSRFGVSISYFEEEKPLGSAGSLHYLKQYIQDDIFLLIYGDIIFDVAFEKMIAFHRANNAKSTLFAHPNSHPFDSDLIVADEHGRVLGFDSKHNKRTYWYDNCVNAGIYVLATDICDLIAPDTKTDLEKDILFQLCERGAVYAYTSPEYVKDVGTPQRIAAAAQDINAGVVAARNLKNKQRCIFLDRDGTLNIFKGLVYKEDDLELEARAAAAVSAINKTSYLAIVVSNQPVVARGLCSMHDVDVINNKLKTLLGDSGAYLDDLRFCPHHPDKGYPEENVAFKIECSCRKPGTGMIDECAKKYNIDLSKSWIIGDTTIDIKTGKNAGLRTALVHTGQRGKDGKYDVIADIEAEDVLAAVGKIINLQ